MESLVSDHIILYLKCQNDKTGSLELFVGHLKSRSLTRRACLEEFSIKHS